MIPYAVAGGPPDDWFGLSVFDRSGNEIKNVVEVNVAEGWLIRHRLDNAGRSFVENDEIATERIEGDFTVVRTKPD